ARDARAPDRRAGPVTVTAAEGFAAAGVAAGIKATGAPDLALVATADHRPVTAAGVFTTNLVAAAPVRLSRRHLAADARAADTVPKGAVARFDAGGTTITVGGMAKGAAMLSPAMATMLAVITTDAHVEPRALQRALTRAVDASFNLMTTDGSRSTNDTVLVLAGGAAGNPPITAGTADAHALAGALAAVCA